VRERGISSSHEDATFGRAATQFPEVSTHLQPANYQRDNCNSREAQPQPRESLILASN
jgi:hypothetical protein